MRSVGSIDKCSRILMCHFMCHHDSVPALTASNKQHSTIQHESQLDGSHMGEPSMTHCVVGNTCLRDSVSISSWVLVRGNLQNSNLVGGHSCLTMLAEAIILRYGFSHTTKNNSNHKPGCANSQVPAKMCGFSPSVHDLCVCSCTHGPTESTSRIGHLGSDSCQSSRQSGEFLLHICLSTTR